VHLYEQNLYTIRAALARELDSLHAPNERVWCYTLRDSPNNRVGGGGGGGAEGAKKCNIAISLMA
jgi:hypothetical protein